MSTPLDAGGGWLPGLSSELERHDAGIMRLVAAIQALSLARNLDTIIDIVRRSAREIARADGATFILREGENCHYVDEDAISPLWKGQRFPMSACISGWTMKNKRAAVIKDIYEDDRIPFDAYRPTFVKSLVMVPIRATDPVGAIGIYWASRHHAGDYEVEQLQALADSTAVAMESVQLYTELEQRVQARTRELEDTNRELETFSYSVSHDLQAPLGHIIAYGNLLTTEYGDVLPEEAQRYLARIEASATRASALINDLLRLSRFTRADLHLTRVNLSAVATELAARLLEDNAQYMAEIEIEDNLECNCDEALVRVVLQNLLANALKFTSKRDNAFIQFGSAPQADGSLAYYVRDNGAGFNMDNADKLFAPFQRLHNPKDFSGTGIGLATIKRIVHRHGGTVWVHAAVNEGATFYFTLDGPAHVAPLNAPTETPAKRKRGS